MKFAFALASFVVFFTIECRGVKIPKEFPEVIPELFMPGPPPMPVGDPEQFELQNHGGYGGYGGYRPEPEPRPRKCQDKREASFCQKALFEQKCDKKRYRKKCARTCGRCREELDCVDTGLRCQIARYQPFFYCSLSWFAAGCKKTCNQCQTTTTTTTTSTIPTTPRRTTPISTQGPDEFECVDIIQTCPRHATPFRCALFWFRSGCEKSCGVCKPVTKPATTPAETTTPVQTTTAAEATTTSISPETTPSEICEDKRNDCNEFQDWYCDIPIIADQCQKFCGKCSQETTALQTTTQSTQAESTTIVQTEFGTEIETTAGVNDTTTAESITESSEKETTPPEMTPGTQGSGEEQLCFDSDEKNCPTWESLGLCYNPTFMDQMATLCRLSCQICQ